MKPASITIRSVAELAGVSTASVSNVLTGKPTVTAGVIARVRAAVDELGYVADHHASRLRSGKQALAGVVVPDLGNPMFGAFVSTLEHCARLDGFDLLVVSSGNDAAQEAERLRTIRSWSPAGLIVIPCDGALAARLPRGSKPALVVADRIPDDETMDLIAVDNTEAARMVTAHLVEQGYRSCLVPASHLSISNVRERWEGVTAACGPMEPVLLETTLDPKAIRQHLTDYFVAHPMPDAIFTLDHVTTLIAFDILNAMSLPRSGQPAFASFDEMEWMRLVTPGLTAVRQPVELMAEAAWSRLMRRMTDNTLPSEIRRLTCAVTIRGSTLRTKSEPEGKAA